MGEGEGGRDVQIVQKKVSVCVCECECVCERECVCECTSSIRARAATIYKHINKYHPKKFQQQN